MWLGIVWNVRAPFVATSCTVCCTMTRMGWDGQWLLTTCPSWWLSITLQWCAPLKNGDSCRILNDTLNIFAFDEYEEDSTHFKLSYTITYLAHPWHWLDVTGWPWIGPWPQVLKKECVPSHNHKKCPEPCSVDAILAGRIDLGRWHDIEDPPVNSNSYGKSSSFNR